MSLDFRVAFRRWLAPHWLAQRKSVVAMVVLTVLWNLASPIEAIHKHVPAATHMSLRFYQWLSDRDPRPHYVKWVTPIEIDDDSFWQEPLSGAVPTNRKYLAQLIRNAADGGAAVIALDFLFTDTGGEAYRQSDNAELLAAIDETVQKGIPVVLPVALIPSGEEQTWKRRPLIFPDSRLRAGLGFINAPADPRVIPTQMTAHTSDVLNEATNTYDSFALKIVQSYEAAANRRPRSEEKEIIGRAMRKQSFLYGSFVPTYRFIPISAKKLWRKDTESEEQCRHRIVLIGATYHLPEYDGRLVDAFFAPIGNTPGLYLHANYIEALLDDRVQFVVPEWIGLLLDLALLYFVYSVPHWVSETVARFVIWAALLLPLVGSYVFLANVGRYLDFEAPLIGCFLHVAWDQVREHVRVVVGSVWAALLGRATLSLQKLKALLRFRK